jgi:hypothetical protein
MAASTRHQPGSARSRQPTTTPAGDPGLADIRALAATVRDLHQQMVSTHARVVEHLIQSRSRDAQTIEQSLDRMLDCACIPEGLALFKTLCRYYFNLNPATTAYYVHAYREMWDDALDNEQETAQ